jgi:hypothetical protein
MIRFLMYQPSNSPNVMISVVTPFKQIFLQHWLDGKAHKPWSSWMGISLKLRLCFSWRKSGCLLTECSITKILFGTRHLQVNPGSLIDTACTQVLLEPLPIIEMVSQVVTDTTEFECTPLIENQEKQEVNIRTTDTV